VQTDRTIPNNKPDITIHDNEKGKYVLTDVANVIKKEGEKVLKYKDLTIEIQRMWNVKTNVIPAIKVATGIISRKFRKYLNNIPGKQEIKEVQETAILGNAHVLWKVLMQTYKRFNIGNGVMCIMNSNYRIAASNTVFHRYIDCFRNVSVNILHKGDNE
jgi:hypothetical protein